MTQSPPLSSIYLEHFGLSEAPFKSTPHTEFFFAGANRGETLEALIYAITSGEGMVKVTGAQAGVTRKPARNRGQV